MGKQAFSVNVTADEVIAPGSTIELTFDAQVDPKSAQGAIRVTSGCEPRSVRSQGRQTRPPRPRQRRRDRAGRLPLVIAELLGTKGEQLVDTYRLPFSVAPLSGKLPAELRVEHAVRLFIDDLHVERVALGRRARRLRRCREGRPPNEGHARRARVRRARQAGRRRRPAGAAGRSPGRQVRPHSRDAVRAARAGQGNERIPIVVWPRLELPPAPYSKASRSPDAGGSGGREEGARDAPRAGLQAAHRPEALEGRDRPRPAHRQRHALCAGDGDGRADSEPGREQGRRRDLLRRRHRDQRPRRTRSPLRAPTARTCAGFDGTGIRVAVWEDGPSVTTNLTFAGRFTTTPRGERSRATHVGDRQEHRGQQAARPRAGLRPLLGEHAAASTRCAGRCATSTARW